MQQITPFPFSASQAGPPGNVDRASPGAPADDIGQAEDGKASELAQRMNFEAVLEQASDDRPESYAEDAMEQAVMPQTEPDDQDEFDTDTLGELNDQERRDATLHSDDQADIAVRDEPIKTRARQPAKSNSPADADQGEVLLQSNVKGVDSSLIGQSVIQKEEAAPVTATVNSNEGLQSDRSVPPLTGRATGPLDENNIPLPQSAIDARPLTETRQTRTDDRTGVLARSQPESTETARQPLPQGRQVQADSIAAWPDRATPRYSGSTEGRDAPASQITLPESSARLAPRDVMPLPSGPGSQADGPLASNGSFNSAGHIPLSQGSIAPSSAALKSGGAPTAITTSLVTRTSAPHQGDAETRADGPTPRTLKSSTDTSILPLSRPPSMMASNLSQLSPQGISVSPQDLAPERPLFDSATLTDVRITTDALVARPAAALVAQRPELPRHISMQLAQAMQNVGASRSVELALNPAELGRVRMAMQTSENIVMVHITAERPETLDLMRRNLDVLAQDFRAIGYRDAQFSFTQQHSGKSPSQQASIAQGVGSFGSQDRHPDVGTDQIQKRLIVNTDRVDIRV